MRTIRKILLILIIIVPVFTDGSCKKQAKCGCDGDMLFELDREMANVYFTETSATFSPLTNPYATYSFCNPGEMYSKMQEYKSGDLLQISGKVFWNCSYLYSTSNSGYSYQYLYKYYDILVTDVKTDLYGKK
jgi:hypothetical protein